MEGDNTMWVKFKGSAATALGLIIVAPQGALAQDIPFDLGTLVLEGERSARPLDEAPASIDVVEGKQADRPSNLTIRDVVADTPNVIFDDNGLFPSVRGIDGSAGVLGSDAIITGAQPRVNVIVDGVTRPSTQVGAFGTIGLNWDTEQVEISRGPQSTLGGRNSLAGNIRIQTNDPVHFSEGALRGYAFDSDGTVGYALMLNTPVVQDQIALRFTAEGSDGNSYVDPNPAPGSDPESIEDQEYERYRAKLLFTPEAVPGLRIVATAEHSRREAQVAPVVLPGTLLDGFVTGIDNEQDVFGVEASYDLGNNLTLEARTSYLQNRTLNLPGTIGTEVNSTSAEILLRGEDIGRINRFVFGASYDRQVEDIEGPNLGSGIFVEGEIETIGIYGEIDYALTDRLDVIAGARFERDNRERDLLLFGNPAQNETSESAFIPRIGLRYAVTDETDVGYFYSEGFRPGGLTFDFFDPAGTSAVFGSETLRQHEIYTRSTFLGGRATFNASAFYYEFDDAQVIGAFIAPTGEALIGNVPKSRGYGAEFDGSYSFGNGFTLTGGLGLLDTEITDAGSVLPGLKGAELPRAPSVTADLGLSYVSNNGWDASINVRHVGSADFELNDGGTQEAYTTVDLAAGYEFDIGPNRTFRVDAFVNNLTDERIILGVEGFNGDEYVGRPRTIGLSGTIRF